MDSLRDTFRDSHEAADQLAQSLREHVDESAQVVPIGNGSRALAAAVSDRLEGCSMSDGLQSHAPRTVVLVAERIRRIGPVDELMAALLESGAERVVIATPLATSKAAYAVDDRADAFVCLRRTPKLGTIGGWYERWTFASVRPLAPVVHLRSRRAVAV